MTPTDFSQSNGTLLGGPAKKYGTPTDVRNLPVHREAKGAYGPQIISCWDLTLRERLSTLLFGKVWLRVSAVNTHPPVSVEAKRSIFRWRAVKSPG